MIVEGSLMAVVAKVATDAVKTAGGQKRKRSSYEGFQSPPQTGK
jgi:hypothetical protein